MNINGSLSLEGAKLWTSNIKNNRFFYSKDAQLPSVCISVRRINAQHVEDFVSRLESVTAKEEGFLFTFGSVKQAESIKCVRQVL